MKVFKPNFLLRGDGLARAVVQDIATKQVLMDASIDEPNWRRALETGYACFYSRSRGKPWMKGEESGNRMRIVDIFIDCDGDTILYLVVPEGKGAACHTGEISCFYRSCFMTDGVANPEGKEQLEEVDVVVHPRFEKQ